MIKKTARKIVSLLIIISMIGSMFSVVVPVSAEQSDAAATVTVSFQTGKQYVIPRNTYTVKPGIAKEFGFSYGDNVGAGDVTVLDALVTAHLQRYPEMTKENVSNYIEISGTWVSRVFTDSTSTFTFAVNGVSPNDGVLNPLYNCYTGYAVNQAVIHKGDTVEFALYQDGDQYISNYDYAWFEKDGMKTESLSVKQSDTISLNVKGYDIFWYGCSTNEDIKTNTKGIANASIAVVNTTTGELTDTGKSTDTNGNVTLSFENPGKYVISTYMKNTEITENGATPIIFPWLEVTVYSESITVPDSASLTLGTKTINYMPFHQIQETEKRSQIDGTTTYYYILGTGKEYNYRVSQPGKVTYADKFTVGTETDDITVDGSKLEGDPSAIDRNLKSNNGYNVADIYLNINEKNHLKLDEGQTFQIVNLRKWQAVDSVANNYFIEPDYHYSVVGFDGSQSNSVVQVDQSGLISAVGTGSAIVMVTYDAMNVYQEFYGAIWPENTGVFVVSVGEGASGIDTGMKINPENIVDDKLTGQTVDSKLAGEAVDSELDVFYYKDSEKGAKYSFTPTKGSTVKILHGVVSSSSMTFSGGFTQDGVTQNGDEYTVNLIEGKNIIQVTKDGKSEYQVLTAKKLSYEMINATNPGQPFHPGDTVKIVFDTVYHPVNKLAGVYNMTAAIKYEGMNGEICSGSKNQYQFASQKSVQTVTVNIPANCKDSYTITGGNINVSGFGEPFGSHRKITYTDGKGTNLDAGSYSAYFGQLPDITILVSPSTNPTISPASENNQTSTTGQKPSVVNTFTLNQSNSLLYTIKQYNMVSLKAFFNGIKMDSTKVTWQSANKKIASVNQQGKVTAKRKGTTVITAKAEGLSVKCVIKVKGPSLKLKKQKAIITENKKVKIIASASPAVTINYKSLDKKVAIVNRKGIITGKRTGKTKIVVSCNGIKRIFTLRVK